MLCLLSKHEWNSKKIHFFCLRFVWSCKRQVHEERNSEKFDGGWIIGSGNRGE